MLLPRVPRQGIRGASLNLSLLAVIILAILTLSAAAPVTPRAGATSDLGFLSGLSGSSRVSLTVPQVLVQIGTPPDPVTLSDPTDVTADSLRLHWTRSYAANFSRYMVYGATTQTLLDCGCSVMETIVDPTETYCRIDNLDSDKKYYFVVRVVDTSGQYSTSNVVSARTLPADLKPPSMLLMSPLNTTYAVSDVALTFWVDESTAWTMYSLDSSPNVTVQGNTTLLNLSEGSHSVVLYAIGNNYATARSQASFAVDFTPPIVTMISPTNTTYETFSIDLLWRANEPVHDTEYSINGGQRTLVNGNSTLFLGSNGAYILAFHAKDEAGNARTVTTAFTVSVDLEPPSILHNPTKSANEGQEIVIYVQAVDNRKLDELTLGYRKAGQTTYVKLMMLPCPTCINAFNATIPASEVTGDIEYYINVSDGRNMVTHPSTDPDTSPNLIRVNLKPEPIQVANATQVTETSLTLSWSASADEDFKNYTIYRSLNQSSLGAPMYSTSTRQTTIYNVTELAPDTVYYFTVRVWDAGNLYADSKQVSARTLSSGWLSLTTVLVVTGALLAGTVTVVSIRRRYIRTPVSQSAASPK